MVPHFTEVAQQGLPATGESLRKGRHRVQLMQIQPHLIRLLSLAYQTLYQHEVGRRVQEQGLGGQAVPACPPRLPVSYTHLRAHETDSYLVCRLLLEKKKKKQTHK